MMVRYSVPTETVPPTCPLHGDVLREGHAVIAYGLIMLSDEHFNARMKLFPRSRSWRPGGCVIIEGESPDSCGVLYCPSCRRAETEWRAAHPEIRVLSGILTP